MQRTDEPPLILDVRLLGRSPGGIDESPGWGYTADMMNATEISQMTRDEKLRAMEALWADLSQEQAAVESPAWHEDALKETESRLAEGKERTLDWADAKQTLRKRFE